MAEREGGTAGLLEHEGKAEGVLGLIEAAETVLPHDIGLAVDKHILGRGVENLGGTFVLVLSVLSSS